MRCGNTLNLSVMGECSLRKASPTTIADLTRTGVFACCMSRLKCVNDCEDSFPCNQRERLRESLMRYAALPLRVS